MLQHQSPLQTFPMLLPPQLSQHGMGLSPGHRRRHRQGKVQSVRGPDCVLQPNHTFPPLFHQSLQLKFHSQGCREVRQEQTCFQQGEGEPNFLPEWAFSDSGLRKCPSPLVQCRKVTGGNCKNNQRCLLQFPEGIKVGAN